MSAGARKWCAVPGTIAVVVLLCVASTTAEARKRPPRAAGPRAVVGVAPARPPAQPVGRTVDVFAAAASSGQSQGGERRGLQQVKKEKLRTAPERLRQMDVRGTPTGPASEAALELVQIVAEIAVERARAKSMQVLTGLLRDIVCDHLQLDHTSALELGLVVPADSRRLLLPRTCETVGSLRLEELGASGRLLLQALLTDVANFGAGVLVARLEALSAAKACEKTPTDDCKAAHLAALASRRVLSAILPTLIEVAAERRTLTLRDGQLLVDDLVRINWLEPLTTLPGGVETVEGRYAAVACGLQLGLAVVHDCLSAGECDPADILESLVHPSDHYLLSQEEGSGVHIDCGPYLTDVVLTQYVPDLPQLVSRLLAVARPAADAPPAATVRSAIDLGFDIARRLADARSLRARLTDRTVDDAQPYRRLLEDARRISLAVVDRDVAAAIIAGADLVRYALEQVVAKDTAWIEDHHQLLVAINKATAVLGALGSYAATYVPPSGGTPVQTAADLHAARKKAVESLIDATTQRSTRDGDVVVSLGANVGFQGGLQWTRASTTCGFGDRPCGAIPQLTLPVGVAIQILPDRRNKQDVHSRLTLARKWWFGAHFQFSLLDLGQFIALDGNIRTTDHVRWEDLFLVGGQVGAIIGTPDVNFVLGLDLRWAPTLFSNGNGDRAGAASVGVVVGCYVPFLDLN